MAAGLIVSWSVRFRIIEQLGSSAIEQFYANIGAKVRGGEIRNVTELAKNAAEVVPSDRQFEQAFGIANGITPGAKKHRQTE